MAHTVWIHKDDGTLQCGLGKEIALEEMQNDLERIGASVLNAEKRDDCRIIIRVCGAPTGRVNAYEISTDDWAKIRKGFVGPLRFRLWTCGSDDDDSKLGMMGGEVPWPAEVPLAEITSVRSTPTLIRELIGRRCRVYKQGDALTMDFVPDRVNIELAERNRIADIWFG